MNRKQSAVAAAVVLASLASAPVLAQSTTTLYGVVDTYFSYGKMGDNKKTGIDSGGLTGSRIGFRGTEELGNGVSAVFALEYGLLNDANEGIGTVGLRARQQFVGLKGRFGFAGLGRQYAPGYYVFKYDGAIGTPWGPQAMLGIKAGATIVPASPARANNALNYISPNMRGLTVNTMYAFGEENQATNRRQGDRFSIGAEYANGPVGANVIYHLSRDMPAAVGVDDKEEWYAGGSYNFGVVTLLASYQQVEQDSDTNKVYQVGAIAPVSSAGKLHFAIGRLDHENSDLDATNLTVGYGHALSKRTTAYAFATRVNNDSAQNATFVASAVGQTGENSTNIMVGVNHSF